MPRFRGSSICLSVLALLVPVVTAAEPPVRDHDIEIADYFTLSYISEMTLAPTGTHAAYVEGRWDEKLDRRNMDLWVVDIATKDVERLTFDDASDTNPRWSPDGQHVYFRAKRERPGEKAAPYDGSSQVWRVPRGGGEPQAITRISDGIEDYALSRDGRSLYYVVATKGNETDHWKSLRTEFKDLEYGHGVVKYSALWKLDLRTWRATKLIDEKRVIGAFAVSDDERRIAMITTPTAELISNEGWSEIDVYDVATRAITRLDDTLWRAEAPSPYGWIVNPVWSTDGTRLAFRVDFDGYPGEVFTTIFSGAGATTVKLTRPGEVSAEGPMRWTPGTHDLCFIADDHARARLVCLEQVGASGAAGARTITPGDVVLGDFDFSGDGSVVAVLLGGLDHTPDVFTLDAGSPLGSRTPSFRRITNINPQVDTWKLPQIHSVRWTSPDGTPVEGILELPYGYDPADGPLPTLVTIHGGPTSSSKLAFRFWIYGRTLFASRGWAVFDPNYRGSTGYGDKFLTDLIGNKNNLDVKDILAGVDRLVADGVADPDRLAVTGWSNGGYLTNCVITTTDRFRAASSGAGVFDTVMQWSIEDTPGHVINYSGGLPWQRAEKMHDTSPLYVVDKVVTPTLIHVGERDERVPPQHSRALHRALHHYLNVPCELIVYPGTGHGLTKYSHRKAKMSWDVAWIEYYTLRHTEDDAAKRPGE